MFNSPSVLAALASPSPAAAPAAPGGSWPPRVPRRGLKRPRGLWKARRRLDPATTATASSFTQHQHQLFHTPGSRGAKSSCSGQGSDTDREMEESCGEGEEEEDGDEDGDDMSQNSNSSKRQRRDSGSGRSTSSNIHIDNNDNDKRNYTTNGMPIEFWTVYVDSETDVGLPLTLGGDADTAGHGTPLPLALPLPGENTDTTTSTRRRAASLISNMVTTSIAERVPSRSGSGASSSSATTTTKERFEYKDWEEIKETLACASELCDRDDPSGSIPLLRAVIHQSHNFLVQFPDPSLFFCGPTSQGSRSERSSSPDSVLKYEPTSSRRTRSITPDSDTSHSHRLHHHPIESPTALHAVLGVALFLFGNIIAQNPSLALQREPITPSPYWLAALDVFNAGDILPSQTNGAHAYTSSSTYDADRSGHADDWRVAIAWGRTLVALASEAAKRSPSTSSPSPPPSPATARAYIPPASPRSPTSPSSSSNSPPRYQPRSPLAAITTLCPPGLSHAARASASELLTLAADQFSRGIFHMPHNNHLPHHHHHPSINRTFLSSPRSSPSPSSPSSGTPAAEAAAQRPYILYTLASEVLAVAERLDDAEARRRWAAWADAVFLQMHMEADVDAWRARVGVARGRCWLVIGSAHADEMEDALERGDATVLLSKEAEVARSGLSNAVSFFNRAKGSASTESSEPSLTNMQPLLTEALLSLANLTSDEDAREALYMRAQAEGDDMVARHLGDRIRLTRTRTHGNAQTPRSRSRTVDVRMDES